MSVDPHFINICNVSIDYFELDSDLIAVNMDSLEVKIGRSRGCRFWSPKMLSSIIIIILRAGVQPTLDPYAEAFIAGPLR